MKITDPQDPRRHLTAVSDAVVTARNEMIDAEWDGADDADAKRERYGRLRLLHGEGVLYLPNF